mgnify:CR=1 FL=1
MSSDAAPTDEIINPETGEPLDRENAKFITKVGNQLTIYLPEELEWYKGPDGERRARQIGDFAVNFQNGVYPPGNQTLTYVEAKLMLEYDKYGDLYALAAEEVDVEPGENVETPPPSGPELNENEVMIDGQIMTKEQARNYLDQGGEAEMENPPEENIDDVSTSPDGESLTVLSEPTNKTEALEALAERGANMGEAPDASASTEAIQGFAKKEGYVIEKYA